MRREEVDLEIFPGDAKGRGHCTQGCLDCPVARERKGPLAYSEESIRAMELFEGMVKEGRVRIGNTSIYGLSRPDLILPQKRFPFKGLGGSLSLAVGELKEDPAALSARIIERVNFVLAELDKEACENGSLMFDVVPKQNKDGTLANMEALKAFASRLYTAASEGAIKGVPPRIFNYSISANHTNGIEETQIPYMDILTRGLRETLEILDELSSSPCDTSQTETNMSSTYWFFRTVYRRDEPIYVTNVQSRFLDSSPRKGAQPIRDDDRFLSLGLFPGYAWVDHQARFASDESAKVPYQEFFTLVEGLSKEESLTRKIREHVKSRRV